MKQPTLQLDNEYYTHHMWPSQGHTFPQLKNGMTLRQTLAELRRADFGDLGGTTPLELSDGTWLEVELTPIDGGGAEPGSQRIVRREYSENAENLERIVRVYKL